MRGPTYVVAILTIGIVVMLVASCHEEAAPDVKKSRLIAAENIQLKKELARRNKEIEQLKRQHQEQLKRQEDKLANCEQEKELWKARAGEAVKQNVQSVLKEVMDLNEALQQQNKRLKALVESLKSELEKAKAGQR